MNCRSLETDAHSIEIKLKCSDETSIKKTVGLFKNAKI